MKIRKYIGISFAIFAALSLTLMTADLGHAGGAKPLPTASGSPGEDHNATGMKNYADGNFKGAANHFQGAIDSDSMSAEAHFNMALALDKLGNHRGATAMFDKALKLGAKIPAIADSGILKKHLGM